MIPVKVETSLNGLCNPLQDFQIYVVDKLHGVH